MMNSTLVIVLSDGTHRVIQWEREVSLSEVMNKVEQQKNLNQMSKNGLQITRAIWIVGENMRDVYRDVRKDDVKDPPYNGPDHPKCQHIGCKNEANPLHACPYLVDVNDDAQTQCNCCDHCTLNCAYAI